MKHADFVIEGFVCQQCGELIDGDEPGFPRSCEGCKSINHY